MGESGVLDIVTRVDGDSAEQTHQLVLAAWLKGADEPDPLGSLGIRPWRPALPPLLAQFDPEGPAQAAGLKAGDRLLALNGESIDDWQQVVDKVRAHPGEAVTFTVE